MDLRKYINATFMVVMLMACTSVNCFAVKFSGTLLCKETGRPIDYANVGL
jgi:hypothetical protein